MRRKPSCTHGNACLAIGTAPINALAPSLIAGSKLFDELSLFLPSRELKLLAAGNVDGWRMFLMMELVLLLRSHASSFISVSLPGLMLNDGVLAESFAGSGTYEKKFGMVKCK